MGILLSTKRLDNLERRVEALERKVGPTMLPDDLKKEITKKNLYTTTDVYPDVIADFCWQ